MGTGAQRSHLTNLALCESAALHLSDHYSIPEHLLLDEESSTL